MRASFILCCSDCILTVRLIVFFENPQQQRPVLGFRNRMLGRRHIPLMIQQQRLAVEGVAEFFGGGKIIRIIYALRRDIFIFECGQLQRMNDAGERPEGKEIRIPFDLDFMVRAQDFAVLFDRLRRRASRTVAESAVDLFDSIGCEINAAACDENPEHSADEIDNCGAAVFQDFDALLQGFDPSAVLDIAVNDPDNQCGKQNPCCDVENRFHMCFLVMF